MEPDAAILLLFIIGLPIVCIVIILFGEHWRNTWVARKPVEIDFDRNFDGVYRESQNPTWCYVLVTAIILFTVLPLATFLPKPPEAEWIYWTSCGGIAVAMLPLFLLMGLFFEVNDKEIVIRYGLLRFPIKRIDLTSIVSVKTTAFKPLTDFGGWGIKKGSRGVTGYFMSGNRGVRLVVRNETGKDEKILIGSDTPERLAEVIRNRSIVTVDDISNNPH